MQRTNIDGNLLTTRLAPICSHCAVFNWTQIVLSWETPRPPRPLGKNAETLSHPLWCKSDWTAVEKNIYFFPDCWRRTVSVLPGLSYWPLVVADVIMAPSLSFAGLPWEELLITWQSSENTLFGVTELLYSLIKVFKNKTFLIQWAEEHHQLLWIWDLLKTSSSGDSGMGWS